MRRLSRQWQQAVGPWVERLDRAAERMNPFLLLAATMIAMVYASCCFALLAVRVVPPHAPSNQPADPVVAATSRLPPS